MLIGVSSFDLVWGGIQIQMLNHMRYSQNDFIIFADKSGCMTKLFEALPNVKEIVICEDHEISDLAKQKKVDMFLHHTVNHTSRNSVVKLKELSIPTVVFHHCAFLPIYSASLIDAIITTSKNNVLIIKQNESFKNMEIDSIHLSLDFAPYDNACDVKEIKKKYGIPLNRIVIGRMGRLEPGKCPEDFLKSAKQLKKKHPKSFFIIGGALSVFKSQQYLDGLKNKARELGLKDGKDILFTGEISEQEKADLLNCMDIFLYPTKWEGYCMAFLEAMYLRKPVITYANFANKETIGNGGVAVKDGDITGLVRETMRLITDKKLREQIGEMGRQLVIQRNEVKEFAGKVDSVLDRIHVSKRLEIKEKNNIKLALVGWGFVDGMESIPEYLQLKHFYEAGLNLDFFCITANGMKSFNGLKINRSKAFNPTLLSRKPQVCHLHHVENPLSKQAAEWAKSQNIPVTMNIHSFTQSPAPYLPLVDKFIVFSEKEFDMRKKEIPEDKLAIIPNGIDVGRYKSGGNKFKNEKDQGKFNILYVGQLFGWKGIYRIVEIANHLKGRRTDFCFHIVSHVIGELEQLRKSIAKSGLQNFVKVYPASHGERPFEELLEYYASCDAFLLLTDIDCFPTTLLEAMASKKPCIATAVGGIPNIVDHEVTGFHVGFWKKEQKKVRVEEVIERIEQLIENPDLCQKMGEAGYQKVLKYHDIRIQIKKYVEVFKEVLKGRE